MIRSLLRRGRAAPRLPRPGPCGGGRHTLRTERLLLYTPATMLDLAVATACGSDPEARRWLGWADGQIVTDARVREALLALHPGDLDTRRFTPQVRKSLARPFEPAADQVELLIGVRLDDGRYAGSVMLDAGSGELGGQLAPHARGQGLGAELFGAAVLLGHAHLGLRTVRAGHEPANAASAGALARAGFVADDGPPLHTLPNGREVDSCWLRHTSTTPPTRCPSCDA
ncbi:GNAT family protein [Streptomyces sp. NPDC050095]|uniref:GNAT family N-acetyltransferase n=1 Tax=unclassified Streptomyces TaxID=2593676 RepID=UPI00342C8482